MLARVTRRVPWVPPYSYKYVVSLLLYLRINGRTGNTSMRPECASVRRVSGEISCSKRGSFFFAPLEENRNTRRKTAIADNVNGELTTF